MPLGYRTNTGTAPFDGVLNLEIKFSWDPTLRSFFVLAFRIPSSSPSPSASTGGALNLTPLLSFITAHHTLPSLNVYSVATSAVLVPPLKAERPSHLPALSSTST